MGTERVSHSSAQLFCIMSSRASTHQLYFPRAIVFFFPGLLEEMGAGCLLSVTSRSTCLQRLRKICPANRSGPIFDRRPKKRIDEARTLDLTVRRPNSARRYSCATGCLANPRAFL